MTIGDPFDLVAPSPVEEKRTVGRHRSHRWNLAQLGAATTAAIVGGLTNAVPTDARTETLLQPLGPESEDVRPIPALRMDFVDGHATASVSAFLREAAAVLRPVDEAAFDRHATRLLDAMDTCDRLVTSLADTAPESPEFGLLNVLQLAILRRFKQVHDWSEPQLERAAARLDTLSVVGPIHEADVDIVVSELSAGGYSPFTPIVASDDRNGPR